MSETERALLAELKDKKVFKKRYDLLSRIALPILLGSFVLPAASAIQTVHYLNLMAVFNEYQFREIYEQNEVLFQEGLIRTVGYLSAVVPAGISRWSSRSRSKTLSKEIEKLEKQISENS